MPLLLTRAGLLQDIHQKIEKNQVVRTIALTTASSAVGLVAGKTRSSKKCALAALGAGGALTFLGLTGIGDGAMAGGATLFGYRTGVKMARKKALRSAAAAPVAAVAMPRKR